MFGISLAEVVLIFVIMIVFIRPNDLPKFLRSAGRAYGKARKIYREIIGVKEQVIKEINNIADMADLDDNSLSAASKKTAPKPPPIPAPPAPVSPTVPIPNTPAPFDTDTPATVTAPAPELVEKAVDGSAEESASVANSIIKESDDLPRY